MTGGAGVKGLSGRPFFTDNPPQDEGDHIGKTSIVFYCHFPQFFLNVQRQPDADLFGFRLCHG